MSIESSETNSLAYPRLLIDANQIKWCKIHILSLDFDWCPIEVTITLRIICTSVGSLGCIALWSHSSLMKHKAFHLRRGWVERNSFTSGSEFGIVHMAHRVTHPLSLWGHERPRFVRSSLVNSRKNLLKLKKTSNYPSQDKPPVPEIPPDLSASRKKPRGV